MDPQTVLEQVAKEAASCTRCELHHSRKNAVAGEGPPTAEIMFIGEGPGFHENQQGRPFVGAAGRLLEELLAKIGLQREDVFITNIVKCRPPGNRDPRPEEVAACDDYLEQQINAINPKVIVTLGRHSMGRFLSHAKISDIHGQAMRARGRLIIPMYHPAAALHQRSLRPVIEKDFSQLPELIEQAAEHQEAASPPVEKEPEPKQLNLF